MIVKMGMEMLCRAYLPLEDATETTYVSTRFRHSQSHPSLSLKLECRLGGASYGRICPPWHVLNCVPVPYQGRHHHPNKLVSGLLSFTESP